MSLRSPAAAEIALTLPLSHQNGRGNFWIPYCPRPLCGRG